MSKQKQNYNDLLFKNKNQVCEILTKLNIHTNIFHGRMNDLIDFSHLFRFCNILHCENENDLKQQSLEPVNQVVITSQPTIAHTYRDLPNTFFLCLERSFESYLINRPVLLNIFIEYFDLSLDSITKQNILKAQNSEGMYSIVFKIWANSGVFDENFTAVEYVPHDPIPFLFQKYYEYKKLGHAFLAHMCERFYWNFLLTGNRSLPNYLLLLEKNYCLTNHN